MIDALTVCFEVENRYHYDCIAELDFGDCYDLNEFRLYRIEGRYYNNVYNIVFHDGEHNVEFGQLKFNLNRGTAEANLHESGNPKAWICLNNSALYSADQYNLDYIATKLGLDAHNMTTIDLCLDTPFNVSNKVKKLIRNKAEFKEYIESRNILFNFYMMDEVVLEEMFFYHLNSVICFQKEGKKIKWENLLGREVA